MTTVMNLTQDLSPNKLIIETVVDSWDSFYLIFAFFNCFPLLGISFAIALPIIGVCFCSCRLCENCGGRMYQDLRTARSKWRQINCISLFGVTLLLMLGNSYVFTTNVQIEQAVDKLPDQATYFVESLESFRNDTKTQKEYLEEVYSDLTKRMKHDFSKTGTVFVKPLLLGYQKKMRFEYDKFGDLVKNLSAIEKQLKYVDHRDER